MEYVCTSFTPFTYYPWFSINRCEFSFLVHPNTGCMYEDHYSWAFWVGHPWPVDLGIFRKGVQTREEDNEIGDIYNTS